MNPTVQLLREIGTPFEPNKVWAESEESQEIYRYAFKNRVGLLYLLRLKQLGRLDSLTSDYERLDFRARETMVTAARAGRILSQAGFDYVIFKTIRPYPATPNDVDILCLGDKFDYEKAVNTLCRAGYFTFAEQDPMQTLFSDPRGRDIATWDKKGGIYYVDLYKAPAVDFLVYLDSKKLKEHIVSIDLKEDRVKVLRPEVEMAAILMHSVFPETTYTLEIFYTIAHSLAGYSSEQIDRFVDFSYKSYLVFPVRVCLSLASFLHSEAFGYIPPVLGQLLETLGGKHEAEVEAFNAKDMKTPYKFLTSTFFVAFLKKLREPSSLKSVGVQGLHMLNPLFMTEAFLSLYRRLSKGTYAQV